MKYDLGHLSTAQLSYLEGLVEKCASLGIDADKVIKLAQLSEIGKGFGEVGNEVTTGVSETPFMKWLASGGPSDVGDPSQYAWLNRGSKGDPFSGGYSPAQQDWQSLLRRAATPAEASKLTPHEKEMADYYQKMVSHPTYQSAAKADYGPTGWARVRRGIWDMIMPGAAERKSRYGVEEAAARENRLSQLRQMYAMNMPKPRPKPQTNMPKPLFVPGATYTPDVSNPFDVGAVYSAA